MLRMQPVFTSIFAVLMACSGDTVLDKTNSNPLAEITSHSDGSIVQEGYPEYLRGVVSDLSNPFDQLSTTWLVDGVEVCPNIIPDENGVTECEYAFSVGDSELTLEVRDPEGGAGAAFAAIIVTPTEAPTAEIMSPSPDSIYYADRLTTLEGIVSDAEDTPSELSVIWESSLDGILSGGFTAPDSEGLLLGATYLSAGEHFLTLTATDLSGKDGRTSATVLVIEENSAPICVITNPTDNTVIQSNESAIFQATISDAEAPLTELSFSWSSDVDGDLGSGTLETDGTLILDAGVLSNGAHTISLEVLDDLDESCSSSIAIIVNSSPSAPTVTISPNPANTTDDLSVTASGSQDPDNDTISYSYNWTLNGFSSSTSDTLSSSATTKGDIWLVEVVPSDEWSDGIAAIATITIDNAPPTIQAASISQTTTHVGDTLVCSISGADPDPSDILTDTYLWSDGSTGSTYIVSSSDTVGSVITCTATLSDGDGGTDQTTLSATVINSDPISSVSISPNQPNSTDILTCSVTASDPDGDSLTTNFSWTVNGSAISATSSTNLDSTLSSGFVSSDSVSCLATTSDGLGGSSVATDSVTIGNSTPILTSVSLSPAPIYTNDTVTVSFSVSDAENDPLTTTVEWFVDGLSVQNSIATTLDGSIHFDKGQTVYAIVTTTDTINTASDSSNNLLIANSPPEPPTLSFLPSTPLVGETLQCQIDTPGYDADGDSINYTFDWYNTGSIYNGATTTTYAQDTISSNITQTGENWTCMVTPDDNLDFGDYAEISIEPCHAILEFDGGNDMITINNLNTMTGDQTMEAWIRLDSPPSSSRQIMSSQCGMMWVTPTEINVQTINGCAGTSGGCKSGYTNDSSWIANNQPSGQGGFLYTGWDGSWKHVAITITTGHVATLYIDGISMGSSALSYDSCMSATTIGTIGRHNVYGNAIPGDIASIRMSGEIVYSNNFSPAYPLTSLGSTEALFGLQSDYGGTTLTDESGSGHNATINDVTWGIGGPQCP